jgi:hypothetical protein
VGEEREGEGEREGGESQNERIFSNGFAWRSVHKRSAKALFCEQQRCDRHTARERYVYREKEEIFSSVVSPSLPLPDGFY